MSGILVGQGKALKVIGWSFGRRRMRLGVFVECAMVANAPAATLLSEAETQMPQDRLTHFFANQAMRLSSRLLMLLMLKVATLTKSLSVPAAG
jgi:hypothetical protein